MINHLAWWGRWEEVYGRQAIAPKRFHLVATSPCEVTNCFCAPQLNIMKIQGVPGNAVMCVQIRVHAAHTPARIPSPPPPHAHPFAWWTFIRMQNGGIMWFKQSRSWQTRPPAELKISPNTLRDQIIGPYVDLPQSSLTCVCVRYRQVCQGVDGWSCVHTCTVLDNTRMNLRGRE